MSASLLLEPRYLKHSWQDGIIWLICYLFCQDGYALTWNNADGYWTASPSAGGSFSPGGDLGGDSINQIVESIQGVVITGTPSAGNVLEATSSTGCSLGKYS